MVTPIQLLIAAVGIVVSLAGITVTVVTASTRAVEERLGGRIDAHEASTTGRFDALEAITTGRFDAFEARLTGRIDGVVVRLDSVEAKLTDVALDVRKIRDDLYEPRRGLPAAPGT